MRHGRLVGGAILALAALPHFRRPGNVRLLLAAQAVLLIGVLGLGASAFAFPQPVPGVPEPESPTAIALLDGSGHPRALSGPAISLDARILAVCDVYDALVSNRVYRDAFAHEQALRILHEEAAVKLDRRCGSALERGLARERAPQAVAV